MSPESSRTLALLAVAALLTGACTPAEDGTAPTGTTGSTTTPVTTSLPDVSDLDLEALYSDALHYLLDINTSTPFAGHDRAMATRTDGCPDIWAGGVEDAMMTADDGGLSWSDDCRTGGGLGYGGWVWWDATASGFGTIDSAEGRTVEGSRFIDGDALVDQEGEARFEFKGTANDYLYRVDSTYGSYTTTSGDDEGGYGRWIYRSTVDGTVTGSDLFDEDSLTPNGWRSDLYLDITGGDVDRFVARGNVYMFEAQLEGRFDSIQVDMDLPGRRGAGPDDCTLEPLGWIGLRDPEAIWYDLVFLPRTTDDIIGEPYDNPDLSSCDGCGTLYIRGIEAGEVCVDLSTIFKEAEKSLPEIDDFVLTLHNLD